MLYDMVIDLVDRLAQGMEVTPTQMLVLGKLKISFLNSNLLTINAPIITQVKLEVENPMSCTASVSTSWIHIRICPTCF